MNHRDKPEPPAQDAARAPGDGTEPDRPGHRNAEPDAATVESTLPHARRGDGPRQTVNDPVSFHAGNERFEGWTLNVSRGGLRAVIEADVEVGLRVEVRIGDSEVERPAKVVWTRRDRGGAVVGLTFLDRPDGAISDIPMPPPESDEPEQD